MDKEVYGKRLTGYSEGMGRKGRTLYRFHRGLHGEEHESKIGIISSSSTITHGPITVTIWTLENGEKYHYF